MFRFIAGVVIGIYHKEIFAALTNVDGFKRTALDLIDIYGMEPDIKEETPIEKSAREADEKRHTAETESNGSAPKSRV